MTPFKIGFLLVALIFAEKLYCQNDMTIPCDCIEDSINAFINYETMASFPGGNEDMMNYIKEKIEYPQKAVDSLLEDKVIVRFCIIETGEIRNIKVMKGKYEILNQEALRVISKMPNWNPARLRGKNVCCAYTIPIDFKLDKMTKRKIKKQKKTSANMR